MKTFVAIVKCQHCGGNSPAVLNRISKMHMNVMHLKNECNNCGKMLNEENEQGGAWELINAPRNFMVGKGDSEK